eukprot:GGOE01027733.1.p2 GENE.GGOE01027733.1~~GGOE01027733.1.p2  ORF type:complete len:100 (+),score=9.54 GGOE01027733.1:535-834(+)
MGNPSQRTMAAPPTACNLPLWCTACLLSANLSGPPQMCFAAAATPWGFERQKWNHPPVSFSIIFPGRLTCSAPDDQSNLNQVKLDDCQLPNLWVPASPL